VTPSVHLSIFMAEIYIVFQSVLAFLVHFLDG